MRCEILFLLLFPWAMTNRHNVVDEQVLSQFCLSSNSAIKPHPLLELLMFQRPFLFHILESLGE